MLGLAARVIPDFRSSKCNRFLPITSFRKWYTQLKFIFNTCIYRNALAEVTNDMQERQHRWRQIEELCGFPIAFDTHLVHAIEVNENVRRSSIAEALAICANLGGIGSVPDVNQGAFAGSSHEKMRCFVDSLNTSRSESEYRMSLIRNTSDISNSGRSTPVDSRSRISSKDSTEQFFRSFEDKESVIEEYRPDHIDLREHSANETKIAAKGKNGQKHFHASNSTPTFPAVLRSPQRSSSLASRKTDSVYSQDSLKKAEENYSSEDSRMLQSDSCKDMLSFEVFSSEESLALDKGINELSSSVEIGKIPSSADELASKSSDVKKKMLKSSKEKRPASFDNVLAKNIESPECTKRRSIFSKLKKK